MILFPVVVYDGSEECKKIIEENNICYIINGNGIYLKKKLGFIQSIVPVEKIPFLEKMETSVNVNIPKIPTKITKKAFNFLKSIYEKYKTESVILLYLNINTLEYSLDVPDQEVSSASVKYEGRTEKDDDDNLVLIGSIHSHSDFGAFHSGTDVNDEKYFDGIHITVGNLNKEEVSVVCSLVSNNIRIKKNPEDYIEGIKFVELEEPYTTVSYKSDSESIWWENYAEILGYKNLFDRKEEKKSYKKIERYLTNFILDGNEKNFNKLWLSKVSKPERNIYNYINKSGDGNNKYPSVPMYYAKNKNGEWVKHFLINGVYVDEETLENLKLEDKKNDSEKIKKFYLRDYFLEFQDSLTEISLGDIGINTMNESVNLLESVNGE